MAAACERVRHHLRPGDPDEPFGPTLVMDGKRSMVPGGLGDGAVGWLREVLAGATVPAVRARIGDVLWVARRDGRAGRHAIPAYLDLGMQVEDADMWTPCMECYERAMNPRLDAAGANALKSMRSHSTDIEVGPLAAAARRSVQGLPLADAVYALACACPTLEPGSLREQVLEAAERSFLSSMFGVVIYDRDGRVVHKHPGLHTSDPEEREQALEALMCRNADLVRGLTVHAQLIPALMGLLGEHVVEDADMLGLLDGSILVPADRAGLFAMGLAAGFRRDMVMAMHLLVPQLEHALRLLLKQAGAITASIDSDGIQSDWPLGRLLATGEIRNVLPETLIFELRSLLVYKGGSNIRNRLCHGLLAPEDFATSNVLYLWWLLLKVALYGTLGYQAWIDGRVREVEAPPGTAGAVPPDT